MFKLKMLFNF